MEKTKHKLMLIGALPPPAIGPYLAMAGLKASPVLEKDFAVSFLDISDRRNIQSMGRLDLMNLLLGVKHACQCVLRLLAFRPQIVYLGISQGTWGYLRDLTFIIPALIFQRKLVLHLRGSEFREFYKEMPWLLAWLTRFVLARTARMIVLGESLKPIFDGLMPSEKVSVIHNGIDYRKFLTSPDNSAAPSPGDKRILYLSHLSRRKGLLLLLESLPEVINRYPDARVTIAGLWQNAAEKAEAVELVRRGKLETVTNFVGEVTGTEKIKLFQQHDLFVFTPLLPEGLPWVILEAMSASLPVITSNQGAISEVVQQGVTGLIVPAKKANLTDAMCRLLNNSAEAAAMGAAGRARVAAHFSEQVYLERLVGVFRELTCPAKAPAQTPAAVSINKPAASHSIEQIGQTGSN